MTKDLPHIIPAPQPEIEATFAAYHATRQFYSEVQARSEMKRYCEWYYTISERHRQELQQMRGDLNILAWFRRRR